MKEKNDFSNKISIKSKKYYSRKQIEININILIVMLTIITIIIICLIIFIIFYIYKIKEISSKNQTLLSNISQDTNHLTYLETSISHKMVNIFAMSFNSNVNVHFSFLFENSEEVQSLKNKISFFTLFSKPHLILIYESNIDRDNSSDILNLIKYSTNILFIIGSKSGEKFAFFFQESVYPDKNGYFKSNTHRCFIYSFKINKEYPCNEIFIINKEYFLNIGNSDIIINHNFKTNGGVINFPFKTFSVFEKDVEFNKLSGNFEIKDIEIYLVFDLNFL